jgi:hypothetical protein
MKSLTFFLFVLLGLSIKVKYDLNAFEQELSDEIEDNKLRNFIETSYDAFAVKYNEYDFTIEYKGSSSDLSSDFITALYSFHYFENEEPRTLYGSVRVFKGNSFFRIDQFL